MGCRGRPRSRKESLGLVSAKPSFGGGSSPQYRVHGALCRFWEAGSLSPEGGCAKHLAHEPLSQHDASCQEKYRQGPAPSLRARQWRMALEFSDNLTGEIKFWLHVRAVSFTLAFASHFICSWKDSVYTNGLPWGTLSYYLDVKPKCLCSGKYPDPVHLWMVTIIKKLIHPIPIGWPFQEIFCKTYGLLPLFPQLLSLSIKELGIQTLIRWLFWDISQHLLSLLTLFWIKSLFSASTPLLQLIGL